MATKKEHNLMSEFPPVSTEQWENIIRTDLKGADYDKKLVWHTAENFSVRPYYRAEDLKNLKYLGAGIGRFPYVRSAGVDNRWLVMQTVTVRDVKEANATARKAIEGGAEAIGFRMKIAGCTAQDFAAMLDGIDPGAIEITLSGKDIAGVAELALDYVEKTKADPETTGINVLYDPIVSRLSLRGSFGCCPDGGKCFAGMKKLIERGKDYRNIRFVAVEGHNFHNSGATIVQELAFTLAAGHDYIVRLAEQGLEPECAARSIRFSMAVSSNYFMEIAKLRAARMLWATIAEGYGFGCGDAGRMTIHAVSSKWNMTVYDPYVNMLRGTTEAMSAATGGVHSLEVLPFDAAFEPATAFSARIARNVQLLLKNESHFDSVTDPSGGSYYIETLTQNIASNAWELFKRIEEKGGYVEAFKQGFIQGLVNESAAKKELNVATRRTVLLGTNQYPNTSEKAAPEVSEKTVTRGYCGCGCDDCSCDNGGCGCGCGSGECGCDCGECNCGSEGGVQRLRLLRGAMPFEEMRLRVDRSGREPKVFMLTAGSLGMARARAQFAGNFFGCAGMRIIDNTFFADVEEGVEAAIGSGAEIVVLCAADDDYATLAPEAFRLIGDRAILVVAGAPSSQPELEKQGIRNFISVRSNVLATLMQYVEALGI